MAVVVKFVLVGKAENTGRLHREREREREKRLIDFMVFNAVFKFFQLFCGGQCNYPSLPGVH